MEYGYEITDTAGGRRFFVEGCTYCRMSTAGLHEPSCPMYKLQMAEGYRIMAKEHSELAEHFLPLFIETWGKNKGHSGEESAFKVVS